ncbi:PHD finger protein 10 isoform X2 [Pezoporus flaviventris]|uniref:PHD finger protein 10 isoform X2 n=1 Tax=Pezoporus flaviventris TaxID=889875 RepID=UPI002AB2AF0B|nr:PHD finger protein 10 isoform X2 [Pezoporus flaviventris]
MVHKRSSSPADVPGDGSLAAEQPSPAACQLPCRSAAAPGAHHRGGMLPLRPALLPKRYRGGSAPRSRPGRAAARAAAGGGGGRGSGGGGGGGSSSSTTISITGGGAPALGPRGGVGPGRLPVRRRGPGSPRAARRGAEQELREPSRSCASWPVGAVATPRRGRGGGAGRGARPGRGAAALLLAQPPAGPAAVMAAVLSPRLCDSDPATPGAQSLKDDTEENSNDGSQPSKRRRMGSGDSSRSCETSSQDLGYSYFPAENLIEYKWPPDETGEYYMLQEQVSEYLGVTSFKRKYPDLERRDLSHKEKLYLRELNVITETQCTLGLTALRSDEVIDLMIKEYPAKHAEYSVILQEKERQRITDHYKEYSQMQQQNTQKVEASKVPEYIKKAAKKAAEFNSNLNRERMEERRAYFDLQTHIIQVPQGKYKILPTERTKVSPYPVALIPGQFQEYYKRYSPDELRYLPLNTALYEPPLDPELPALDSDGDSDDAEEGRGDEKRKTKGNSPKVIPNAICGICLKGKESNKKGKAEALIHCSQCDNSGHPSCLDMTPELVAMIKTYPWQCMECKTCIICGQPHHEEEMMFCDVCDRGYHTFCVGLHAIPSGRWICDCCQKDSPVPRRGGRRGKTSKEG